MRKLRTIVVTGSMLAVLVSVPAVSLADSYKAGDSDHVFRYISYPAHAVGKGLEMFVTRPIHCIVSQPKWRHIFGHVSRPNTDDYHGDANLYQRYSY